jgi:hypothetical protein
MGQRAPLSGLSGTYLELAVRVDIPLAMLDAQLEGAAQALEVPIDQPWPPFPRVHR